MKISEIKDTFRTRKINEQYVEFLIKDFTDNGFKNAYPVSVDENGVLWDGNHRLAAAIRIGMTEIPHIIETPENMRFEAHERNRVAANNLPETFVDQVEEVWGLLEKGLTQTQIADDLGCTQARVSQLSKLENLCPNAWGIITGFSSSVIIEDGKPVINIITTVITENLLRNILDLTEHHQLNIINDLINGNVKNGQVKKLAEKYAVHESLAEYAIENLLCKDDVPIFFKDCFDGLFKDQQQIEKAVKQANDEYEKTNSIRVIPGDCLELLNSEIANESCDTLITDPPYAILDESWDTFKDKAEFIAFSREWITMATNKIKSTGRVYIFWSQEFMFDFPFDAVSDRFVFGNVLIWNYKNNIKPSNQKIYKHTWEPCFYFYGVDAGKLNLPNNKEWDADTNDYDMFEFAQPQSNFTDKKEHPAQKPEKLISQLVNIGSDIGDTVLDCFAGSGTTGVCCKKLKRKAILIERENSYLKIINSRIANV